MRVHALTDDAAAVWASHLTMRNCANSRSAVPGDSAGARNPRSSVDEGDAREPSSRSPQSPKGRAVVYPPAAPKDGLLVVVGGGTNHSVASNAFGVVVAAARVAGTGALKHPDEPVPFTWDGERRWLPSRLTCRCRC